MMALPANPGTGNGLCMMFKIPPACINRMYCQMFLPEGPASLGFDNPKSSSRKMRCSRGRWAKLRLAPVGLLRMRSRSSYHNILMPEGGLTELHLSLAALCFNLFRAEL